MYCMSLWLLRPVVIGQLVIGTGNPRVAEGYPYLYPPKPIPLPMRTGTRGYGYGGLGIHEMGCGLRVLYYI